MLKKTVLRKKRDFDLIYKKGKSAGDRYVVVFIRPNGLDHERTAFLASKKVGKSVERNRARRLMKEAYRALYSEKFKGYDLIIIARNTISGVKEQAVENSLKSAISKTGILEKGN